MPSLASPHTTEMSSLELLLKHDRPVPRYTSYPTATAFHAGVSGSDLADQLATGGNAPLSLYVNVPFCRHAFWYCGCNRITTRLGSKVVRPYLTALAKELQLLTTSMPQRRPLGQLHWGGGTPNYLNREETVALWRLIESHFQPSAQLEASIEVNPEFLTREEVLSLRQLGFNRISFGLQDAHPEVQQAVNRVVPVEQLRRVMGWLREAAFDSVNVDLICGLPAQTRERFHTTLALVSELRPDRLSLFSFAYLPEQLPLQRKIDASLLPSQQERIAMHEDAHRWLSDDGYDAIGMDHYALATDPLAIAARGGRLQRNFQGYTTGAERDVLALGPSAISQFPHLFTQNHTAMSEYSAALERGELPVARGLVVRDPDLLERRRLIANVMCRFETELDLERYAPEWRQLTALAADGVVRLREERGVGHVAVSSRGRWLLRSIAVVFDPLHPGASGGARNL